MPDEESGTKAGDDARRALRKSKLKVTKVAVRSGRDPNIQVEPHIRDLIIEAKNIDPERVVPDARIREDLGFDDLDFIELILAIEETFEVEIRDGVAERIRTVGDAIITVQKLLGRG